MNTHAFLQLPPGSTGLFLEDAARHQEAIDATNRLYASWGYTMVHTPLVDFFDAHSHMISESDKARLYRLIGREGEVLMLRSDITIFLLKHYQSLLKGANFPVRLAYSDSIIRHEDSIDISRNDHYQTGAELIGAEKKDGDLEVLFLLCENLMALGLAGPAIHLGSRRIFDRLFPHRNESEYLEALQNSIISRNWNELSLLIKDSRSGFAHEGEAATRALCGLFACLDDGEMGPDRCEPLELVNALSPFVLDEVLTDLRAEVHYLQDLIRVIGRHFPDMQLRLDLSEIGARHYYSGLVFYVYADGIPYAVASGGRYDRLLEEMGLQGGAVGYSVMLSALKRLPHGPQQGGLQNLKISEPDLDFEERYALARSMRAEGKKVCL